MKKRPRILFNKYFITLILFAIIMLFFNRHNLIYRWKTARNVKSLKKEIRYYENKIEEDKKSMVELQTDLQSLEKYAREKYYLKRENEDVFIIEEQ